MSASQDNDEPPTHASCFDLTLDSSIIEKSFVAISTTATYIRGLITFMIWLYDNHKQYLKDDVIPLMDEQTILDDNERNTTPKRKPSRKRKRVIVDDNDTRDRKNLREFCRTVLKR